jgi:hypothetical protein
LAQVAGHGPAPVTFSFGTCQYKYAEPIHRASVFKLMVHWQWGFRLGGVLCVSARL